MKFYVSPFFCFCSSVFFIVLISIGVYCLYIFIFPISPSSFLLFVLFHILLCVSLLPCFEVYCFKLCFFYNCTYLFFVKKLLFLSFNVYEKNVLCSFLQLFYTVFFQAPPVGAPFGALKFEFWR